MPAMKCITLACVIVMCAPALPQTDPKASRDAKLIVEVKQVSVHRLDEALPELSFEKWLAKESGTDAQYHWEINDCGEQTGAPGGETPIPTCVEVDSTLKDGREIVIFIADDRPGHGQPNKSAPPHWTIAFAELVTPHEKINLRRLSDLPVALIKTHQLTNNPEIAK